MIKNSMQQTIERYRRHTKDNETNKPIEQNLQIEQVVYTYTLDNNFFLFLSGFDWVRWRRSCSIHAFCQPEVHSAIQRELSVVIAKARKLITLSKFRIHI